jgi:hypothetical protein
VVSPSVTYAVGGSSLYYAILQPSTTYYFNIKHEVNGVQTRPSRSCNIYVELQKPNGLLSTSPHPRRGLTRRWPPRGAIVFGVGAMIRAITAETRSSIHRATYCSDPKVRRLRQISRVDAHLRQA